VTKIIINSQVSAEGQSEDLKALAKLMNNEPVNLNKHFDYAQRRIKEINEDPETREKIILYETRMLEREQAAGKAGYEQGMRHGVEQGKVDSAKIILENQLNNGRTLEQATEFFLIYIIASGVFSVGCGKSLSINFISSDVNLIS